MCASDTTDLEVRRSLSTDETVGPLLNIWFASGDALDEFCQPFAPVVRELKAEPPTLINGEWDTLEGKVKSLLADQLSRSCFRGTSRPFIDRIGRNLVLKLLKKTLKIALRLPAAILYLLPALAHSEELEDLDALVR